MCTCHLVYMLLCNIILSIMIILLQHDKHFHAAMNMLKLKLVGCAN